MTADGEQNIAGKGAELRKQQLAQIAAEIEAQAASPLYEYRKSNGYSPVLGEGDVHARIVFVGEAPGEREAKTGRPFVGASGRFLDELLGTIGLERSLVYITNVVKDRPPENRDPTKEEIEFYAPVLRRQLEIIQPITIATLGRFSMDFILHEYGLPGGKISQLHGKILRAKAPYGEIAIVPLFHPAVALYNREQRQVLIDDFKVLKQFV